MEKVVKITERQRQKWLKAAIRYWKRLQKRDPSTSQKALLQAEVDLQVKYIARHLQGGPLVALECKECPFLRTVTITAELSEDPLRKPIEPQLNILLAQNRFPASVVLQGNV